MPKSPAFEGLQTLDQATTHCASKAEVIWAFGLHLDHQMARSNFNNADQLDSIRAAFLNITTRSKSAAEAAVSWSCSALKPHQLACSRSSDCFA
ncbi:hypothetical protein GUJ93_ZPchr0001g30811 [Zizania palustris]|uniref:Uncharacterized protein n=1 Tax=Zizania palustris TaxID=103762 RepID=A0A8J5VB83_ZIZPA|nr:hypothetical protein GUJ93_ZPchr0001g30811 [Zizania palustris]